MNTLPEIEKAILNLSPVECERLSEWMREMLEAPLRVAEPRAQYASELREPMTLDEYMEYESNSRIKHEYLAGHVFAMSGASLRHNRIVGRVYRAFSDHLKGGPCEPFISDLQLKLRAGRDDYIYYPDVMIVCGIRRDEDRFVSDPKLIAEVLSPSTAGVDRHEKRVHYRCVPALEEYVIVAQETPEVTVYRRSEEWRPAVYDVPDAVIELRSIGLALPIDRLYESERYEGA